MGFFQGDFQVMGSLTFEDTLGSDKFTTHCLCLSDRHAAWILLCTQDPKKVV